MMDHHLIVIEKALWDGLIAKIDSLTEQVQELVKDRTKPDILTHREAAFYLGYSSSSLHDLKDTLQIPFIQHGKKVTYLREDLNAFMAEHRIKKRRR
ncbi:helix-turn-helix domain-containing protein [Dyadobacter sp. CY323]|uniref:helix-turn-helix domain-containing protein n=1 Tax=Dyadobacter sp. CY323 TaxID=2907302 RepID=UPI001F418E91|nr:helix-turn-helix domain-containing protein [Dyadobacter sp. CY323]MCE6992122.1 helix-turn-helix domain-containing protein [Dyadobacter sp. CY323]